MNYLAWPRDGSRWPLYAGLGLGVGLGTGSFVETDAYDTEITARKEKCRGSLPKAMVDNIVTYAKNHSEPKRGEVLARKIIVWARRIIEGVPTTTQEPLWPAFVQSEKNWTEADNNPVQTEIDFRFLVKGENEMNLALSPTLTHSPFFMQRAGAYVVGTMCGAAAASGIVHSLHARDVFIYDLLAEVADAAVSLRTGTFETQKLNFALKYCLLALHMHLLHKYSPNTIRQRIAACAQKQQAENSKT